MKAKTAEAEGWGLRIGGPRPYLSYQIQRHKNQIEITESYHRAVRVVLIPAQEWARLKKGGPAVICECEDFKVGMSQIINAQVMASPTIHSWGSKYTGEPFKYCPWCGKILKIEGKE